MNDVNFVCSEKYDKLMAKTVYSNDVTMKE